MKKRTHRILAVLLCGALVFSGSLPADVYAEDEQTQADIQETGPEEALAGETAVLPSEEPGAVSEEKEPEVTAGSKEEPEPSAGDAEESGTDTVVESAEGAAAGKEPEAEMNRITSAEKDIMPIAGNVSVLLYFREKNPPFSGNNAENAINSIYFTLKGDALDAKQYDYTFVGPDNYDIKSFKGEEVHPSIVSNKTAWYELGENTIQKGGKYTLKVREKGQETLVCSAEIEIYKVTFNPDQGKFDEDTALYTGYGAKDCRWTNFNLPSNPVKEGTSDKFDGYIGWAVKPGQTTTELVADTVGGAIEKLESEVQDFEITLYAAYGQQTVTDFEIQDENGSAVEKVVLEKVKAGTDIAKTLTIINVGNQPFTNVSLGTVPDGFDIKLNGNELQSHNSKITMTIAPKVGASLGTHSGTLWVFAKTNGEGRPKQRGLQLSMQIIGGEVTVTPDAVEKEYGKTITVNDVKVKFEPEGYSFASLGATLTSQGFRADANVGKYDYEISGNSGYSIELDKTNKVTVKPAGPKADSVNATGITTGQSLESSTLSGTFTNPYTGQNVTGTLEWEEKSFQPTETGDYSWKFTPTGADEKNYETITGKTRVQVGDKTPTNIILEGGTSFTYDGKSHGLTFKTDRVSSDKTPIVVEYNVGNEWTAEPPKKAGSYSVRAKIAETDEYLADEHEETLTIEKATLTFNINVNSKVYDGTTDAVIGKLFTYGKITGDDVAVTATGEFGSKDVGNRVVNITYHGPTGRDADNYKLNSNTAHAYANIMAQEIKISISDNKPIKKEYGEQLAFSGDMFTATGLVAGETLADQHVDYSSDGADSAAQVGEYEVKARAHGGNYKTGSSYGSSSQTVTVGKMSVVQAEPAVSLGGVTAGEGKKGNTLESVPLSGSFVNPHNSSMPVEGTLEWDQPDKTLPNTGNSCSATWKFTPSDTKNYTGPITGEVNVVLVDKTPIEVVPQDVTVTYDGEQHGIPEPELAASMSGIDKNKIRMEIEYKLKQEIVTMAIDAAADDSHVDYSTVPPTEAGVYDVHVHVYALEYGDTYADNLQHATLTINPAAPNSSSVEPTNGPVEEGTQLSEVQLELPLDVHGEPLEGVFTWEHPDTFVTEDGLYQWIFTPTSSNYHQISGSVTLTLAEDTRTIVATVYNLPNDLGYPDYAAVDITKSGLKQGDQITFFEKLVDGEGVNAESDTITVEEADVEKGFLRIQLDEDALADNDGVIFARITSSKKHKGNQISFPAEMGFTVPDTLTIYEGDDSKLDIVVANGYESDATSVTANEGDFVSIKEDGETIHGESVGSTTVQVKVTFKHPDQINHSGEFITLTKTVHVVVKIQPGDVTVEVETEGDAPRVEIPSEEQLADRVLDTADKDKIEQGVDITVALTVKDIDDTVPQTDKTEAEKCAESSDFTVGQYLDISLSKTVGNEESVAIYETNAPITLTIDVPADLQAAWRVYEIIRVHNGKAEVLEDLDKDPAKITFATNLFSTYAIAYRDPVGDLTVTNKVTGSGDKSKAFNFTVTLEDKSINGKRGGMDFTDGVARFTLKHGESLTAKNLPAGMPYTVVEAEANKDGYKTTATGDTGTIQEGENTAAFVNQKDSTQAGAQTPAQPSASGTGSNTNKPAAPQTGDASNSAMWAVLLVVSLICAVTAVAVFMRKRSRGRTRR